MRESKEIAVAVLRCQIKYGIDHTRVPILVGKTQVGKTYWVSEVLSKELNLPVVKILLQSEMPDEVLGFQKLLQEGEGRGKLSYLTPGWFPEQPSIVFFDELDKADASLHSAVLTLLRNGEVRGRRLPKGSVLVGAMNEYDMLEDTVKARCIFLPFLPETRDCMIPKGLNVIMKSMPKKVSLPEQVVTPEGWMFFEKLLTELPEVGSDPVYRRIALTGLFPSNLIPELENILEEERIPMNYRRLLDDDARFERFLATVKSVKSASDAYMGILAVGKTAEDARKLGRILEVACGDSLENFKAIFTLNYDYAEANLAEIARIRSTREFVEELEKIQKRLYKKLEEILQKNKSELEARTKGGDSK